jgi:tRNA dimethylallyltransferase
MNYNLITILGPTATGKTRLAALLAHKFKGEIISADSRQVYKGMDIGTGKDLSDYIVNNETVAYHLIDIISPKEEFNLFLFNKYFYSAYNQIIFKKKLPFLVGGTGLYLSSILQNYKLNEAEFKKEDFEKLNNFNLNELKKILLKFNLSLHNTTDLINKERIIKAIIIAQAEKKFNQSIKHINKLVIGILPERFEIKKRITERLVKRLNQGMIEEVESLIKNGVSFEKLKFFGLEYKFIAMYLKGELNYNDMFQKLNSAINNFAKRQITWFRKMEREGVKINWLPFADFEKAKNLINNFLNN